MDHLVKTKRTMTDEHATGFTNADVGHTTETGSEAIERLRFLASFPLADTGKREEGEKTQPFNRSPPHLELHSMKAAA